MLQIRGTRLKNQAVLSWAAAIRAIAQELADAQDLELVRGAEGHGTRLYFQAFTHLSK
jgi:CRISPR/Cas system-associated endonuclease Cas1